MSKTRNRNIMQDDRKEKLKNKLSKNMSAVLYRKIIENHKTFSSAFRSTSLRSINEAYRKNIISDSQIDESISKIKKDIDKTSKIFESKNISNIEKLHSACSLMISITNLVYCLDNTRGEKT